ncbi:DUF2971 domain-containing protein [Leptospira stimsonii]|uniref:DUF2971 domain-containing protein n=1 Tax=Leptospira stimsonii TaxID=2202203 RepID=A0A8B3CKR8_9LEPT|nr:DUF2971 domain-containing protein [Leptospira stimsonii]RHX83575.1 hypothetical protein DLM78_21540 [Leptospira stimsonii]
MLLFKYRGINEFSFKLILDNEFYFAKPSEFNDPFDSRTKTIYQGTFDDWYNWLRYTVGEEEAKAEKLAKEFEHKYIDDSMLGDAKKDDNRNRILCLSKTPSNILMWAHYADQHKGFCLGFESIASPTGGMGLELEGEDFELPGPGYPKDYLSAFDITYNNEIPPPWNRFKDRPSDIFKFLLR